MIHKEVEMKFPNKYTIGWIGLLVGLVLIYILWLRRPGTKEGFQTADYKTLNVDYPMREVYLVGDNSVSLSSDYSKGYTYQEAADICKKYDAEPATLQDLKNMYDSSAHWCAGGWLAGDPNNLYYPSSGGGLGATCFNLNYTCIHPSTDEAKNCIRKIPVTPTNNKGFALCKGVKPPQGTPYIKGFNPISYTILDTDVVSYVQNQSNPTKDIFPISFTPQQAYYALEKTNFNLKDARQYLKDNYTSINADIRNDAAVLVTNPLSEFGDNNTELTGWENSPQKSCEILGQIQSFYTERLTTLRTIFQSIRARTEAVYWTKEESMNLQSEIAAICADYTSTTSPACTKLATIDYTIFYNNDTDDRTKSNTEILAALESLNYTLASLQCEMQSAFKHLQVIMDTLKCSNTFDTAALGNYQSSDGSYLQCSDILQFACKVVDGVETCPQDPRFLVADKIGYNTEQSILIALKGVSPLFNLPGYKAAFESILNNLSYVLNLPSLNDYSTSAGNFMSITKLTASIHKTIKSLFP
jgi:hypothetical protein